jgi:SAM-dependent methyltransferase
LGLTRPLPHPDAAGELYSERTSIDFQPGDAGFISSVKLRFARRDARSFARLTPNAKTILDYGCGNGAFTIALKAEFPGTRVFGADYHTAAPKSLRPDEYIPYQDLEARSGEFDLILLRHVLEHTYDPVQFLEFLRKLLSDEGVLAIEVPSLNTPFRKIFGKCWDGYYVPYHPLHFTRESLTLATQSAGLTPIAYGNAEMPKMGRSLRNVLGCQYGPLLFAAGVALHPLQLAVGLLTGTAVCQRIWARK